MPKSGRWMCLGLFVLLTGCGERPFADWGLSDPWSRKSWQEDERFGPTFHTKRAELRSRRQGLSKLKPDDQERAAIELSQRLAEEQHATLRIEIIRALAELSSPMAEQTLQAAINESDPDVRVVVCEAWGRRGGELGRQMLAQMLGGDTEVDVRLAAARELGKFKQDPEAMRSLRLALDENNPALQYRAIASLKNMSGRDYGSDLVAWRDFVDGGNPPEPPPPSIAERLKQWY